MVRVLFFAQLRERIGKSELQISTDETTVNELKKQYLAKYGMDELLDQAMVAVNEVYAAENSRIQAGDVVAFIPPVSGG